MVPAFHSTTDESWPTSQQDNYLMRIETGFRNTLVWRDRRESVFSYLFKFLEFPEISLRVGPFSEH